MRPRAGRAGVAAGAALVWAAVVLAGCSNEPEPPSGTIVVACTGEAAWCEAQARAFEGGADVTVKTEQLTAEQTLTRLGASDGGGLDVWLGCRGAACEQAREAGRLLAYSSPNAAAIPEYLKNGDGYWTAVGADAVGLCGNPTVLADLGVPTPWAWSELTDPRLATQVLLPHPASDISGALALATQRTLLGTDEAAIDYFTRLNPNVFYYYPTAQAAVEALARGDGAVAVVEGTACRGGPAEAPLTLAYPSEGVAYEAIAVAINARAANVPAAQAFVDFALTGAAQDVASVGLPAAPDSQPLGGPNVTEVHLVQTGAASQALIDAFAAQVAPPPTS